MWIPPETVDPVLLHHPTRRSIGYFGAVRLRDGKLVYRRETTRFNAGTCFDFLWHLWKVSSRSGRRVIVITDNARYHHAALHKEWRKTAEPWFRLEYLPPYSPDLNPIERVWQSVKDKLSWLTVGTLDELRRELDVVLNSLTAECIASLTGYDFILSALKKARLAA